MKIDLTGKRAIVCGSSQGIGKATAVQFAKSGATVCLIARNEAALADVKSELNTDQGQIHDLIVADFSQAEDLRQKIHTFVGKHSPVHILVNNTGGPPAGAIFDAEIETFSAAFSRHLICNHILTQAVVPGMKAEKYGRIINIISTSVKQPLKGLGVSNTVRGAVANWAKTMAGELAPFGITVNNLLPGATNTQRLQSLIENKANKSGLAIQDVERQMISGIPAGRFAEPEELAFAATFLASPLASYINGINLPVDGGRTLCL